MLITLKKLKVAKKNREQVSKVKMFTQSKKNCTILCLLQKKFKCVRKKQKLHEKALNVFLGDRDLSRSFVECSINF